MSNKLTDTQLVQEMQHILAVEAFASDAVRRVRELLAESDQEASEPRPIRKDTRGWIEFDDSAVIPLPDDSTAWERHDDPEQDR